MSYYLAVQELFSVAYGEPTIWPWTKLCIPLINEEPTKTAKDDTTIYADWSERFNVSFEQSLTTFKTYIFVYTRLSANTARQWIACYTASI